MWDKEKQKLKMKPVVDKLVAYLKKKDVFFEENDGSLENVVFSSGYTEFKISHHSLYRYSGIICTHRPGAKDHLVEIIPVTDEMYINTIIKPILVRKFKIGE